MLEIDGNHATIEDVVAVARGDVKVSLAEEARERVAQSQGWVQKIVARGKPVYGINTGFGIFASEHISPQDSATLSRNLILSHAVGTGSDLPEEVVRTAMLIRANTFAKGHSGVRPVLIDTLLEMLNKGVTPCVPSQGSLGSSGDLAPLAHLALVFTTDGKDDEQQSGRARYHGRVMSGAAAMRAADIERIVLGPKEGLAITNGATFSAALAALCAHEAYQLVEVAEIALGMSLEALQGVSDAFDGRLHEARPHPGQSAVAEHVRALTRGSTLLNAAGRVQDAYSLRCAPQVHGPVRDTLAFIREVITRELNAATDNPLLFDSGEALSGGNFHGQPIGMAMDYLKIALSELAAISERRTYHLTDGKMNAGLPPMLVDHPEAAGLNSGMMMLQYTAASLVLENQSLATPDSIYSLPTSGGKEDHNANAMTAARHAQAIVDNLAHVLAVEVYCAARALDLALRKLPKAQMGVGTAAAHAAVRRIAPYQAGDAWWSPEVEALKEAIVSGDFNTQVAQAVD